MMPEEIMAKFANSLEQFEPIARQLSGTDLTRILEVVALLLLQIPYDQTVAVHNLISIIRPEAAYITRYGAALLKPTRVGAYNAIIDDDTTAVVCARTEAVHKVKRINRTTYETE